MGHNMSESLSLPVGLKCKVEAYLHECGRWAEVRATVALVRGERAIRPSRTAQGSDLLSGWKGATGREKLRSAVI